MKLTIHQVDAFTDRPFAGNPAAVCVTPEPLDDALMQSIASEMNLSETAFAVALAEGRYSLRWFTPEIEVRLCGHATLATTHVLFEVHGLPGPVTFETLSGELIVSRSADGISMDFPADPPTAEPPPAGLLEALGVPRIVEHQRSARMRKSLALLPDADAVRAVRPDFGRLTEIDRATRGAGFIVTAADEGEAHFVSRYFAPWAGINEDPVTGAAHTVLAQYWANRLGLTRMRAHQASRRGGWLDVVVRGDRVDLIGQAVIVMEGHLRLG